MPKGRDVVLLGLAAWIAVGRTPEATLAPNSEPTCIELRLTTAGMAVVPVQLEAGGVARGLYSFLLDTGSETTFVDEGLADAFALLPASRTTVVTASGPIQAVASRASLTFGAVQVRDLEMVRDPLTALRAIAPEIRGVLGQDVLRRTNWLLDYRAGVVIQDADGLLGRHIRGDRLPLRWIGDRPTVEASFGRATPVRLVLDSAASGIVLFKLPIGVPTGASARMTTLGIERVAPLMAADALHISSVGGSIRLPHPVAAVLPQDDEPDEAGGLLPTTLFDALYFDQNNNTAIITAKVQSTKCKVAK